MSPLDVVYGPKIKQESIFEKLVPFVEKIVTAYKQKKIQEYDNEIMTAVLADIDKPSDQETIDTLMQKLNSSPPGLDIEGATEFAKKVLGSMTLHEQKMGIVPTPDTGIGQVQQKEIITGGLPAPISPTMPQIAQKSTQKEAPGQEIGIMPDKWEWNEIYKFVQEQDLPIGESWDNTLAVLNQRLESGKKMTELGGNIINMILGKKLQEPTQKEQIEQDVKLTDYLHKTLYPESETRMPGSEMELFLTNPQLYQEYKETGRAPQTPTQWDKKFDIIMQLDPTEDELKKFLGVYIAPGNKSDFEKKFDLLMKTKPSTNEVKKFLGGYIKPEGPETTNKLTPTYSIIQSINEDLMDPTKNYDTVLSQAGVKYDLSDPNIKLVTKADRSKKLYDFALTGDEKTYGIKDADIVDEDGFVKDEAEYKLLYKEYEKGAKEYYKATGQLLPKEYLSPEEAGKFISWTWGAGYKGGLKPVKNTENIPWSWEGNIDRTAQFIDEAMASGKTLADYDIEELKKAGVDIEKARQALGN